MPIINAYHQNVHGLRPEMPLCSVHHHHVTALLRQKREQKLSEALKVEVVLGHEALNATLVGIFFHVRVQRQSELACVDSSQLQERTDVTGHELP
jgi:hypothetical protein